MKLIIKRPVSVYLIHALCILVAVVYAVRSLTNVERFVSIGMAVLAMVSIIRLLKRRDYVAIESGRLLIYKNFAKTISIRLRDISRVEIEPWIFMPSKIYMKDRSIISYWDSMVPEIEMKELLSQFNIPVE